MDELKKLLDYLPLLVTVMIALGLNKALANLIDHLSTKAGRAVKKTETKVDDMIVLPIVDEMQELADRIRGGRVDAKAVATAIAEQADKLKSLTTPKKRG